MTSRSLAVLSLATLGAVGLAPVASAEVLTVSSAGDADFTQIQPAIDSAADGDVIYVRPHHLLDRRYQGFTIDGKSLTIRGEGRPHLLTFSATISSIPAGGLVVLDGLDMNRSTLPGIGYQQGGFQQPGLSITDCQGAIRLFDCSAQGRQHERVWAGMQLFNALDVAAANCTFIGGGAQQDLIIGAGGIQSIASRIALYDSEVVGGYGTGFNGGPLGHTGGPGMILSSRSVAWLVDSSIVGGVGAATSCSACPNFPGEGGTGITVQSGSICFESDCLFEGGAGSPAGSNYPAGSPGVPVIGSLQSSPGTGVPFDCERAFRAGDSVAVRVEGSPGDTARVAIARSGGFRFFGPTRGAFLVSDLVGPSGGFVTLGTIPATGVIEADVTLPSPGATDSAERFILQAMTESAPSQFRLSAPRPVIVYGRDVDGLIFDRGVIYVASDAATGGDGRSWGSAYSSLAAATRYAPWEPANGQLDIWMKRGTYFPQTGVTLLNRVGPGTRVLGGFHGTETAASQADPALYRTIMDGDPGANGFGDNLQTAIRVGDTQKFLGADGVEIRGFTFARFAGSPIQVVGDTVVASCRFVNNQGPVVYHRDGNLLVDRCKVEARGVNTSTIVALSVAPPDGAITIRSTAVLGSRGHAVSFGPNLSSTLGDPPTGVLQEVHFDNSTFYGPSGGIFNGPSLPLLKMTNCIVASENASHPLGFATPQAMVLRSNCLDAVFPEFAGNGNLVADAMFVDAIGPDGVPFNRDGDVRLAPGSPCIDAGDSTLVPLASVLDLDGNPRVADDPAAPDTGTGNAMGAVVDMGAFER